MKIADLNETLSRQGWGQLRQRKRALHDLDPVGFNAPGIESRRHCRTDEACATPPDEFSTREGQSSILRKTLSEGER
jgi:hypothetical protein